MTERPPLLADWPTEWEIVLGSRPGTYHRCRACGTEMAPRRRCYEQEGQWVAEYGTACPNGCEPDGKLRLPYAVWADEEPEPPTAPEPPEQRACREPTDAEREAVARRRPSVMYLLLTNPAEDDDDD